MKFLHTIIVVLHSDLEERGFSRAVFLEQPNKGYAAGLNRAVRHLRETQPDIDTVLAMNPDIELDHDAINLLLQTHEREKADATFPSIREGNLLIQGYALGRYGTLRRVKKAAHLFPGTCFLFSIDGWKKAGGFSEDYFHYFEDLDFCEKLYQLNGKLCHVPNVVINHLGKSGGHYPATLLPRYAVRNHLLFMQKYGTMGQFAFWNICLRHLFYLLRWPAGWRGISQWYAGIREFREMRMEHRVEKDEG
jgi:GT2 family glycosyltransferase